MVDYYVYAIGQVQQIALTGKESDKDKAKLFLDDTLMKDLVPLYDVNQQMAEFGENSAAYQHVTGLQLKGTTSEDGILVVGSAAYQIAAKDKMDHSFLQYEYSTLITELLKATVCFEAAALEAYGELLLEPSLSELRKRKYDKKRLATQEKLFLLNFESKLREDLLGDRPSGEDARQSGEVLIKRYMVKARQLCYYFKQRVDAAEYLYDENGKLQEKMEVAEMQTAGHKRTLPNTVGGTGGGAAPLLGAVERNISATNATVPQHVSNPSDISEGLNFLETPTVIRVFIAAHYPNIEEPDARQFIQKVLELRKGKDNGFSARKIRQLQEELLRLEKKEVIDAFRTKWPNVKVNVKFRKGHR